MDWYFLVRDTNRAAEFWIVCNLWICPAGNPWRRLLQKSIWHITNAWTKRSAVCLSRNERIFPILWSANDADRHFCATNFSIVNLSCGPLAVINIGTGYLNRPNWLLAGYSVYQRVACQGFPAHHVYDRPAIWAPATVQYCDRVCIWFFFLVKHIVTGCIFLCTERIATGSGFRPPAAPPVHMKVECSPPPPPGCRGDENGWENLYYPSPKVNYVCALHFWSHMGGGGEVWRKITCLTWSSIIHEGGVGGSIGAGGSNVRDTKGEALEGGIPLARGESRTKLSCGILWFNNNNNNAFVFSIKFMFKCALTE